MARQHQQVLNEINSIITVLVQTGLVDDQNFAYVERSGSELFSVKYSADLPFGSVFHRSRYHDQYWEYRRRRSFNLLMLDGALVQMSYEFKLRRLLRHRLAFLPSPSLLDFQNHPDLYFEDILDADVVDKRVAAVPIRFDYDSRPGVPVVLKHPKSHLTLGQYSECRIPVSAGLSPHAFVEFVLNSFYQKTLRSVDIELPSPKLRFDRSIEESELQVIHIGVPTYL